MSGHKNVDLSHKYRMDNGGGGGAKMGGEKKIPPFYFLKFLGPPFVKNYPFFFEP